MTFRHEVNKENNIEQDLEVFDVSCSSVKGRNLKIFIGEVEELIARAATTMLLCLGPSEKSFEGFLISQVPPQGTKKVFRHILSAVLVALACN